MRPLRAPAALVLLVLSAADGAQAAPVASVFGGRLACVVQNEVQYCEGGIGSRVESWDGVPLDVNVTLPPPDQAGPFPLIVDLHGWGLSKTAGPAVGTCEGGLRRGQLHGPWIRAVLRLGRVARTRPHADGSRRLREAGLDPPGGCALRGARHPAPGRTAGRRGPDHPGPRRRDGAVLRRRPVAHPRRAAQPRHAAGRHPGAVEEPGRPRHVDRRRGAAHPVERSGAGPDAERPSARLRHGRLVWRARRRPEAVVGRPAL